MEAGSYVAMKKMILTKTMNLMMVELMILMVILTRKMTLMEKIMMMKLMRMEFFLGHNWIKLQRKILVLS